MPGEAEFEVRVPIGQVSIDGPSRPAEGDRQGNGPDHQGQRVLRLRALGRQEVVGRPEPQDRQRGKRGDKDADGVDACEGDGDDRDRPGARGEEGVPTVDALERPAREVRHPKADQDQSKEDHGSFPSSISWPIKIVKEPLRARVWDTAPCVAPSSSAICDCDQPRIRP